MPVGTVQLTREGTAPCGDHATAGDQHVERRPRGRLRRGRRRRQERERERNGEQGAEAGHDAVTIPPRHL